MRNILKFDIFLEMNGRTKTMIIREPISEPMNSGFNEFTLRFKVDK